MPYPSSETRSGLRATLAKALLVACALSLSTGCFYYDRSGRRAELRETKRLSECRWAARRSCGKLAKTDESLDVDACVSERAWQCSLVAPDASEESKDRSE